MPIPAVDTTSTVAWLAGHAVPLLIAVVVLLLVYRWARPAIHRLLVRVMHSQAADGDPAIKAETDRRLETIEDLLGKLLRFGVFVAAIIVVLGVFDLWPVLAGLGLVLAALTLAGQSIILDYLMGLLILTEGQYFKGDVVRLAGIEGTVEEVGLRRTIVRDVRGTVHSISNGEIRIASNLTRTYSTATVDLDGIADKDVEAVIEILDAVGLAIAEDETFAPLLLDVPEVRGHDPAVADGRDPADERSDPARRDGCRSRPRCGGGSRPVSRPGASSRSARAPTGPPLPAEGSIAMAAAPVPPDAKVPSAGPRLVERVGPFLAHYVPITTLPRTYPRAWLRPDLLAGVTSWVVMVPVALAYAGLAGVPPEIGLTTAFASLAAYAIFGTSRHLKVTASSTMAIMSAAVVVDLAAGDPARYLVLTSALALIVGVMLRRGGRGAPRVRRRLPDEVRRHGLHLRPRDHHRDRPDPEAPGRALRQRVGARPAAPDRGRGPGHQPVHARDRRPVARRDPRPAGDLDADPRAAHRPGHRARGGAPCSGSRTTG